MPTKINCRIQSIDKLSEDTASFTIESIDTPFTSLEPGAHIDVYLHDGMIRQYSIWKHSSDGKSISIAVKREDEGSGGSKAMHQLSVGHTFQIDGPRNNFKLIENAPHYTLFAGGIGVTPIFPMVAALQKQGADFDVYYLVQKRELAAFDPYFKALNLGDKYHLHSDEETGEETGEEKSYFDFKQLLSETQSDSLIYACGPEPMLNALMSANSNHVLHYEKFSASIDHKLFENTPFEVKINSTGKVYKIAADETILGVLSDNGIEIPSACTEGVCGTCITDVLEGDIEHRDEVLSEEEKASNEYMCVCVSRAKSKMIVLDI